MNILLVVAVVSGLLAAGVLVALRPRSLWALGGASGCAALTAILLPSDWDSLRMALRVAAALAAASAVLVVMPRWLQRGAISAAIVFHFGGIITAITSVPPPFGPAPWLASQLWSRVYRPYFQFMYMFNAYHFYSPDPGPATVLWACIGYSDDSYHWYALPSRHGDMKDPLGLSYYRRLSLCESANQLLPTAFVPPTALEARRLGGMARGIPDPERIAELLPNVAQYRQPNDYTRRILQSYAHHIAQTSPHADPGVTITGIKIYRVLHSIVPPEQLQAGKDPQDSDLYLPFFQGEFDSAGNLKDANDPLLYWLIPIIRLPVRSAPIRPDGQRETSTPETLNFVDIHATHRVGRVRP